MFCSVHQYNNNDKQNNLRPRSRGIRARVHWISGGLYKYQAFKIGKHNFFNVQEFWTVPVSIVNTVCNLYHYTGTSKNHYLY